MSTGLVIVLIVVGVLILIALFFAGRRRQEQRLESQFLTGRGRVKTRHPRSPPTSPTQYLATTPE